MKIRTTQPCGLAWSAIDVDTYNGAPDSKNRHMIGYGATEQEAIDDLKRLIEEMHEADDYRRAVNYGWV